MLTSVQVATDHLLHVEGLTFPCSLGMWGCFVLHDAPNAGHAAVTRVALMSLPPRTEAWLQVDTCPPCSCPHISGVLSGPFGVTLIPSQALQDTPCVASPRQRGQDKRGGQAEKTGQTTEQATQWGGSSHCLLCRGHRRPVQSSTAEMDRGVHWQVCAKPLIMTIAHQPSSPRLQERQPGTTWHHCPAVPCSL